jgi:hypothetical protein
VRSGLRALPSSTMRDRMSDPQPQEKPPEEGQPHVPHGTEQEQRPREAQSGDQQKRPQPEPKRIETPATP